MGAKRLKGRAWGNALGGWRKQRRGPGGQFARSGVAATRVGQRNWEAAQYRKQQVRKAKRRAAAKKVAVGVVAGVAVAGAAYAVTGSGVKSRPVPKMIGSGSRPGTVAVRSPKVSGKRLIQPRSGSLGTLKAKPGKAGRLSMRQASLGDKPVNYKSRPNSEYVTVQGVRRKNSAYRPKAKKASPKKASPKPRKTPQAKGQMELFPTLAVTQPRKAKNVTAGAKVKAKKPVISNAEADRYVKNKKLLQKAGVDLSGMKVREIRALMADMGM